MHRSIIYIPDNFLGLVSRGEIVRVFERNVVSTDANRPHAQRLAGQKREEKCQLIIVSCLKFYCELEICCPIIVHAHLLEKTMASRKNPSDKGKASKSCGICVQWQMEISAVDVGPYLSDRTVALHH